MRKLQVKGTEGVTETLDVYVEADTGGIGLWVEGSAGRQKIARVVLTRDNRVALELVSLGEHLPERLGINRGEMFPGRLVQDQRCYILTR